MDCRQQISKKAKEQENQEVDLTDDINGILIFSCKICTWSCLKMTVGKVDFLEGDTLL